MNRRRIGGGVQLTGARNSRVGERLQACSHSYKVPDTSVHVNSKSARRPAVYREDFGAQADRRGEQALATFQSDVVVKSIGYRPGLRREVKRRSLRAWLTAPSDCQGC